MKKLAVLTLLVMSLSLAEAIQAQAPVPVGEQFQINSNTTGQQRNPVLAADAEGNFVVVWESSSSSGTDATYSIQGRRYDAAGNPEGGDFQVNSYTPKRQWRPSVAADPDGYIVVVWQSIGSDGFEDIQAQRYDASGALIGGEFQVNSYTTGGQWRSSVAADAEGNFVVVWQSTGSHGTDTDEESIQGQLYDANGTPVGGQFQVNTYTTGQQRKSSVAADAQGNFVVVWYSHGSDGTDRSATSIQGQRYDATGAAVGAQFQVNSYTTGGQEAPAVAEDSQGNFVVVWESIGSDGTDTGHSLSIQGRRSSLTASVFADGFESGDTSWCSRTVE